VVLAELDEFAELDELVVRSSTAVADTVEEVSWSQQALV
jgi:hypothetical protein